ncbi:MAG: DUF262 domain-containing protein [Oscillospiraceae bacterium]|nr:DUF262 domain-containing protein [Oscillospiraceae bacterium]
MSNVEKYAVTQLSLQSILGYIRAGDIAIPEIQRPFVWSSTQVRDLLDSLYNGYPTGYLIVWQNPDVKLKDGKNAIGKKVLLDGQQRVTALMASIAGIEVFDDDYNLHTIPIAFNPAANEGNERFAVPSAAIRNDKHWIPDISEVFKGGFSTRKFTNAYLENNPDADEDIVDAAITRLISIVNCQIGMITLSAELSIEEVTEIFIRINSKGMQLNQADFAMSKIAADTSYGGNMLRKAIDYFCHLAVKPEFYAHVKKDIEFSASEYAGKLAWLKDDKDDIYDPDYNDMLRVAFMFAFDKRSKLSDLVSLLSGRDFTDRKFKEEIAEQSFKDLKRGVLAFMHEYNFEQFTLAIKSAGFITPRLLNSQMTLNFAYTLLLRLQESGEVPKIEIKRHVQKWFVFTTLTSRYITSPETRWGQDLRAIADKGFLPYFQELQEAELSDTFWDIQLVQRLETSSSTSPFFNVFIAAQVWGADRSLLSASSKVSDLIGAGDVHHIFPKGYLKENGMNEKSLYNQVANYTYLDTSINIAISNKPPSEYFTDELRLVKEGGSKVGTITNEADFFGSLTVNCIPHDVVGMTVKNYTVFLQERRKLMAKKIKTYYFAL